MNKRALLVAIILLIVVTFSGFQYISLRSANNSGLKVISNPPASIFLDDRLIGKTPYEGKYKSGEYIIKLIPEEVATSASSWQGKIVLQSSLLTFIRRDLGPSEFTSAGEILSLEKISGSEAQIAVLSTPDGATVIFDGQEKETTPLLLREVNPGEHDITLVSPGFVSRTIKVQATLGYKLTVNFQLALLSTSESAPETTSIPKVTGEKQQSEGSQVLIKDTPTGFLRVRSDPTTSASEIARIKPGEKYQFIEEKNGWYKIIYEEDKEGWISGRYAEKTE